MGEKPTHMDAWGRILDDDSLTTARRHMSIHNIRTIINARDLHPTKAKQINAVQTPTPKAERHSDRATKESN